MFKKSLLAIVAATALFGFNTNSFAALFDNIVIEAAAFQVKTTTFKGNEACYGGAVWDIPARCDYGY